MVIALIIYTMTMEKLKQIATLKLIGAPDRTIIGLIVQQALALGGVGWAFGADPDPAASRTTSRAASCSSRSTCWRSAGIIFVVCIAASGLGVRAALKVDPATALGG